MFNIFLPALTHLNTNLQLSLPDAPVAVGRSGLRIEKGVSTSGLLGERLMISDDPQKNSLVQRKWLPHDDPALNYRLNGVPKYEIPEEEKAFTIGEELKGNSFKGWTHHRKVGLVRKWCV